MIGFRIESGIPSKETLGIVDDPDTSELIDEIKKQTIAFIQKLGIDVSEYLADNGNIYMLPPNLYALYCKGPDSFAFQDITEVAAKEFNGKFPEGTLGLHDLRHEFIHLITCCKIIIYEVSKNSMRFRKIGLGYLIFGKKDKHYMQFFLEGLTELMNLSISLENKNGYLFRINYTQHVGFIRALACDIARKLNKDPSKTKLLKVKVSNNPEITANDVLAHFYRGMIEGDRRYLKIISDLYDCHKEGKKTFNALKALANMGKTPQEVLDLANAFGLRKDTEEEFRILHQLSRDWNWIQSKQ